jgi:hypothetical protein
MLRKYFIKRIKLDFNKFEIAFFEADFDQIFDDIDPAYKRQKGTEQITFTENYVIVQCEALKIFQSPPMPATASRNESNN